MSYAHGRASGPYERLVQQSCGTSRGVDRGAAGMDCFALGRTFFCPETKTAPIAAFCRCLSGSALTRDDLRCALSSQVCERADRRTRLDHFVANLDVQRFKSALGL